MITKQEPHCIYRHTKFFLWGKGMHKERQSNTVIQIYGFQGKPLILPNFFIDMYFVVEVCR